jgi:hypothetical protein
MSYSRRDPTVHVKAVFFEKAPNKPCMSPLFSRPQTRCQQQSASEMSHSIYESATRISTYQAGQEVQQLMDVRDLVANLFHPPAQPRSRMMLHLQCYPMHSSSLHLAPKPSTPSMQDPDSDGSPFPSTVLHAKSSAFKDAVAPCHPFAFA